MAAMAFLLMTPAQRNAGEALNGTGVALGARKIDNSNSLADNLGHGAWARSWANGYQMHVSSTTLNMPDGLQLWVYTRCIS